MSKQRNANEKRQKRTEKESRRSSNIKTAVTVTVISVLMIASMLIMLFMPGKVILRNVDGAYVDPSTGIVYRAATPLVYEPKSVYADDKDIYGVMDGDNVYEIEGIGTDRFLARELYRGLVTVYHAENIEMPTLEEFEAVGVIVFEDGAISLEQTRITEKDKVLSVVKDFTDGNEVPKPEGITDTYNLRFESEKYPFLYYCVMLVRTGEGDFYCDHESGKYYPASDIIGDAVDAAKGK